MSRLYLKFDSDSRNSQITSTGHQYISGVVLWGSAGDSKKAVEIMVSWREGEDQPTVKVFDCLGEK